jgi:CheY-like chemotaxis protein
MNKEFLNVIVVDEDEGNLIFFKSIFKDLKVGVKVQCFTNGDNLMEYLNSEDALIPEIVFMKYEITKKSSIECLEEIKMDFRFSNIVTAVYSNKLSEEEIENVFVKGANIFIKKPEVYEALKKILTEVITINWQYHTSGLNIDNFMMKVG